MTDPLALAAKPAEKEYQIHDRTLQGLMLRVQPSGAKSWVYRRRVDGKPKRITLGSAETTPIAEARAKVHAHLAVDARPLMPPTPKGPSFAAIVEIYLERRIPHWKPSTRATNECYLRTTLLRPPDEVQLFDSFLYDTDVLPGLEPMLGDRWIKMLAIQSFPSSTVPALLDRLNALPFEYRWTSRFLSLDKRDAEAELSRLQRQWFAKRKSLGRLLMEMVSKEESGMVNTDALNKAGDADAALRAGPRNRRSCHADEG